MIKDAGTDVLSFAKYMIQEVGDFLWKNCSEYFNGG